MESEVGKHLSENLVTQKDVSNLEENFILNEINGTLDHGRCHVRKLPYYLENFVEHRPVVVSRFSGHFELLSNVPDVEPSSISENKKDANERFQTTAEYTRENGGQTENHTAPVYGKHYSAAQQPTSYETYLNYVVQCMGDRPEFKQNAKRFVVLKKEPNLPIFVSSKYLHPKIFWREIRQPRDRIPRVSTRQNNAHRKILQYQRPKSDTFCRNPNSPVPALAKDLDQTDHWLSDPLGTDTGVKTGRKYSKHPKSHKRKKKGKSKTQESKDKKDKSSDNESNTSEPETYNEGDNNNKTRDDANENSSRSKSEKKEKKMPERKIKEFDKEEYLSETEDGSVKGPEQDSSNVENHEYYVPKDIPTLPHFRKESNRNPRQHPGRQRSVMPTRNRDQTKPKPSTAEGTRMFSSSTYLKGDNYNEKSKMQSWLREQLDFSLQSCRFELPIDGRALEATTPIKYLRNYCIVTSQFQSLYQKVFRKYQCPITFRIEFKNLEKALRDVAVNSFSSAKLQLLGAMINLEEQTPVDYRLFTGMAALAERLTDTDINNWKKTESQEGEPTTKEMIETADFSALDWKFKDVLLDKNMKQLLMTICSG